MSDHDTGPGTNGSRGPNRAGPARSTWRADDRPTHRIVRAVAEATDREMTALPPLARRVDPDAVNAILDSARGNGTGDVRIVFDYAGVEVVATSGGAIVVRPARD